MQRKYGFFVESEEVVKFYAKGEGSRSIDSGPYRWPYMDIIAAEEADNGLVVMGRLQDKALLTDRRQVNFGGISIWAPRYKIQVNT